MLLFSYMWKMYIIALLTFLPAVSFAVGPGGLVPCDGSMLDTCESCDFILLIDNIFKWLGVVLSILFVIILVVMGLRLVSSVGGSDSMTQARRIIASATIGYIIFMASWFAVDFGLKLMVNDEAYGFWDKFQCTDQAVAQKASRLSASGYNDHVLTPGEIASIPPATGDVATDIANAAAANGITDPDKLKVFEALIAQESTNCTNKVSPAEAYGCGQITIPTARSLDQSLRGLTDAQIKEKLINDNAYNLNLSAKNYNLLNTRYKGDTDLVLAAYNGGLGANNPSTDCPGLKRWQCTWDSPGCYGTSNTSCTPNEGYKETRNYVKNINNAVK